jgi:hypothetical protein
VVNTFEDIKEDEDDNVNVIKTKNKEARIKTCWYKQLKYMKY